MVNAPKIRALREKSGYSNPEFARHLGVSQPTLTKVENGHLQPSADLRVK